MAFSLRYRFYNNNIVPAYWVATILPSADASLSGSWTIEGGSQPPADFTTDLLPALSGTGDQLSIDMEVQDAFGARAIFQLQVLEDGVSTGCPRNVVIDTGNHPQVQLGVTGEGGFEEFSDALITNVNLGYIDIEMKLDYLLTGEDLPTKKGSYVEIEWRKNSTDGDILAAIYAPVGAELASANISSSTDPAQLTANQIIDKKQNFLGAGGIQSFMQSGFQISDGAIFSFDKRGWVTSLGLIDDDAIVLCMVARVTVDGFTSDDTYSCMPKTKLPGRLDNPFHMHLLTLGEVLVLDVGSNDIRNIEDQGVIKTMNSSNTNSAKHGVTGDPTLLVQNDDTIYHVEQSTTLRAEIFQQTRKADLTWEDDQAIFSSIRSLTYNLKTSLLSINSKRVILGASDAGLSAYYWTGTEWREEFFGTDGLLRGLVVDDDGDIYGIAQDSEDSLMRMYRFVLTDISSIPVISSNVVGTFIEDGDVDGAGDGTGGFGGPAFMAIKEETGQNSFYLTDEVNNKIRRLFLTPGKDKTIDVDAFEVEEIWGSTAGYVNGAQGSAKLNMPQDILSIGNDVYLISEKGNNVVRRWEVDNALVYTHVGDGFRGSIDSITY